MRNQVALNRLPGSNTTALTSRASVYLMENAAGKDFEGHFVCALVTSGDSMASHVARFTLANTVAFGPGLEDCQVLSLVAFPRS